MLSTETGLLAVACLINDLSELENIRQEAMQGGMAERLHNSLTTIAGYAQQLANQRESELATQLAEEIAREAAELDKDIARFMCSKQAAASAVSAGVN